MAQYLASTPQQLSNIFYSGLRWSGYAYRRHGADAQKQDFNLKALL
jgi:hypothetical protein